METQQSKWQEVLAWLKAAERQLPAVLPPELPPEESPGFWFAVCRAEMSTRDAVSAKLRTLINGSALSELTLLEAWFFRRRFEWAGQAALSKVIEGVEPDAPLAEVLDWSLVKTWETDGCIALWNHAERDGKPHPENVDGLSPIPPPLRS